MSPIWLCSRPRWEGPRRRPSYVGGSGAGEIRCRLGQTLVTQSVQCDKSHGVGLPCGSRNASSLKDGCAVETRWRRKWDSLPLSRECANSAEEQGSLKSRVVFCDHRCVPPIRPARPSISTKFEAFGDLSEQADGVAERDGRLTEATVANSPCEDKIQPAHGARAGSSRLLAVIERGSTQKPHSSSGFPFKRKCVPVSAKSTSSSSPVLAQPWVPGQRTMIPRNEVISGPPRMEVVDDEWVSVCPPIAPQVWVV